MPDAPSRVVEAVPEDLEKGHPSIMLEEGGGLFCAIKHSKNIKQPTTKGPVMGYDGRPGRKAAVPPGRSDNPEPDAALWSEEPKKIILIELTVPWEEGCDQAFEWKSAKYQDLLQA